MGKWDYRESNKDKDVNPYNMSNKVRRIVILASLALPAFIVTMLGSELLQSAISTKPLI